MIKPKKPSYYARAVLAENNCAIYEKLLTTVFHQLLTKHMALPVVEKLAKDVALIHHDAQGSPIAEIDVPLKQHAQKIVHTIKYHRIAAHSYSVDDSKSILFY